MCQSIKNVFDKNLTFIKLLEAHERAAKGKKCKKEVIRFEMDLESNLINIIKEIKSGKYKFGKYKEFIIYEPKKRLIKALPYKDRVVHQWYVEEFIKPFYCKRFIKDSYACLENKGNHKAILTMQKYMNDMYKKNKDYYVLKFDIKKYFYSIDKNILFNILKRNIKDKKLLEFTKIILDDGSKKGIPIGNYTSQYFANIYLNVLDQYIKNELRIKYYIRYMDDFVLLVNNKEQAKVLLNKIKEFLLKNLDLELNSKCRFYHNRYGINFCGYIIFNDYILLRKRFKIKFKKNIKLWNKLYLQNKLDKKKLLLSYNSFLAHAKHANSYNFLKKNKLKIKINIAN